VTHPYIHARNQPDKPAIVIAATGETITYAQLDERSNQGAQLLRSLGVQRGDVIAVCMENHPRYLEISWANQRSGSYLACISSKATAAEAQYIIEDCGAKLFITSSHMSELAQQLAPRLPGRLLYMVGDAATPYRSWERERERMPKTPIADESAGADMLYSSGTTGRPKGIKSALPTDPIETPNILVQLASKFYGLRPDSIYLSPAPLYHAAPLRWCMTVNFVGGTVILMDRFDAERALALIERYKVTHAQWVPTHFVRMLRLPPETRARYDVSSMKVALHAAAPCAIPVKEQMIDWWGSVVYEYYAGTEGNGMTAITAAEWLQRKGSVGRAINGEIHICDETGEPVAPGTEGTIYFSGGREFEYHNAPQKTRETRNRYGWSTLGDVGYVDRDGYLFLTDRKAFMIISGGVNIYPQEIENVLIADPRVMDVAVFGAPDEEMGEKVVAVVQPVDFDAAGPTLAGELLALARQQLSHVKVPRLIEFTRELPRHPNGKLYKRLLRDEYWKR
jgi:acyl-CoA synthetase (AMP-forming)/AMP-acid ligase II